MASVHNDYPKFELKALTDIWTGDVLGKSDSMRISGLRGSLRWWYEALIRALYYYVCSPTQGGCILKSEDQRKIPKEEPERSVFIKGKICPACYLFGCTGWRGKFNLRVRKEQEVTGLSAGDNFTIQFIPFKEPEGGEKLLLQMIMKIIVDYGAIGGRTTFKPSEKEPKNFNMPHRDYGILGKRIDKKGSQTSDLLTEKTWTAENKKTIKEYLNPFRKDTNDPEFPNLRNFWFVEGEYINRKALNQIVGRREKDGVYDSPDVVQVVLGGYIESELAGLTPSVKIPIEARDTNSDSESKKIFSFHGINPGTPQINKEIRRCFGYISNGKLTDVLKLIECHATHLNGKIKTWKEISDEL